MPGTARDYFSTESTALPGTIMHTAVAQEHAVRATDPRTGKVIEGTMTRRIEMFPEAGAIFNSFLLPPDIPTKIVGGMIQELMNTFASHPFMGIPPAIPYMSTRGNKADRFINWRRLTDTKVLHFYTDKVVPAKAKEALYRYGDEIGVFVRIRDKRYCDEANKRTRPHYFICHDSRDKVAIAAELADRLSKHLGPIWYDEYSLVPGDSLREAIEKGIKECRKGIIIVSKHFLENEGWARNEFTSFYTREVIEKKRVMIPIRCQVTQKQVYEYSPVLADRVALQLGKDIDAIARKLVTVHGSVSFHAANEGVRHLFRQQRYGITRRIPAEKVPDPNL